MLKWRGGTGPFILTHLSGLFSWQASVIGKRLGRKRWSPSNQKTVEGTIAFILSVTLSALILRLSGQTEEFSVSSFMLFRPSPRMPWPSSTLLMGIMTGFQVYLRGCTFFTAGSLLYAERQSDITGLPLEYGCVGRSVGILRGSSRRFKVAVTMTSVVPEGRPVMH